MQERNANMIIPESAKVGGGNLLICNELCLSSIVIPTKNRQKYCLDSIRHIVSLGLDNIEIVIQDNSDEPILFELLKDYALVDKIKYNYSGEILSFVDNFSKAVENCSGEYICMIGDDDSILPNIISVAEYAKTHNIDAVIPQLLTYFWPSQTPINPSWANGFLSTLPFNKQRFEKIDVESKLICLIQNNFQDYQKIGVPRIYHGLIKRECIEAVKDKAGEYFGGLTPDMFMSVALCFTVKNAVGYSMPFTISGICPTSGSADSATGRHTGELKDAPHFRGHKSYTWNNKVPYIYTVDTIWAETGLQAIDSMSGDRYLKYYNPIRFSNELAIKFPQFIDKLTDFKSALIGENSYADKTVIPNRMTNLFKIYFDKAYRFLTGNIAKKFYNVSSISEACDICCRLFKI